MIEVTRGGLTLRAGMELTDDGWTDQQRTAAWTLLALGAEQVHALGGDRRRGLGRCVLTIAGLPDATRALLSADTPPVAVGLPETDQAAPDLPPADLATTWQEIQLDVTCIDPVVSAAVATDGVVRGESSVPGARILPIVIFRARQAGIDIEPLVRAAALQCHPLLREVDGAMAWPAPLSALRREVEQRAATVSRDALGALGTVASAQLGQLRRALAAIVAAPDRGQARGQLLDSVRTTRIRAQRWSPQAAAALEQLLTDGAVFDLLEIEPQDRIGEEEDWVRGRLLAHQLAGGAGGGDTDGA